MIDTVILAILQGIAEFLPISSSGHLVLGKSLIGMSEPGLRLDIMLHVGTLVSVCVFYFAVIARIVRNLEWDYAGKVVLSAIPAGVVGVLFKDQLEELFASAQAVGAALLFTGVVLLATRFLPRRSKDVSWWRALLMGVAQAVAILPGVSRSGMTIAAARASGVEAGKCAEFSFLMSIPPIAGAALLEIMKSLKASGAPIEGEIPWSQAAVGAVVAAVVGYLALKVLVKSLKSDRFWLFGPYCLIIGALTLCLAPASSSPGGEWAKCGIITPMNISELNQRYGAPGRIVFHEGFAGYPNVVLANKFGSAEIALLGANVLSYRPTGQSEVLFRSAKKDADYNRGDKVHVGIPVCWPQFGSRFSKELPQHGFAKFLVFEVRGTEYSEEMTEITLGLKSDEETMKLWPHEFDIEYKVSVSMKLNLTLVTKNTGKAPFEFSCGYHPYFLLRNRDDVTVKGISGRECLFSVNGDNWTGVRKDDFAATIAPDDVFRLAPEPKHEFAILDPGLRRAIAVVGSGNDYLVVWNSGEEQIPDHGPDDWRRFICVEPVGDWPGGRKLDPGESYTLAAAIQSTLEQ